MKIRYKKELGEAKSIAKVYSKSEHKIDISKVDKDAIKVVKKLTESGHAAYIVGGAVRDLIIGNVPKDFDVVTSANPSKVRRLFYNSRIIGKRFLLVHVSFGRKIIEVSTFRGEDDGSNETSNNIFGTIEEDAKRRDFSLNSLYYDPFEETVIDFTNGFEDIKKKKIRSLLPLNFTFKDDPVRMIRAIKYSVTTGFRMQFPLKLSIKYYATKIQEVSNSRLTDEVVKILHSSYSADIIKQLYSYHLLQFILPFLSFISDKPKLYNSLREIDKLERTRKEKNEIQEMSLSECILGLIRPSLYINTSISDTEEIKNDLYRQAKVLISPITPPNFDLETACTIFMKENGIVIAEVPTKKVKPSVKNIPKIKKRKYYYYRRRKKSKKSNVPDVKPKV